VHGFTVLPHSGIVIADEVSDLALQKAGRRMLVKMSAACVPLPNGMQLGPKLLNSRNEAGLAPLCGSHWLVAPLVILSVYLHLIVIIVLRCTCDCCVKYVTHA
jgi:hypothetical protein